MIAGIFHQGSLQSFKLGDILLYMGFQKGHIGYNKGKHLVGEWRNCLRCQKNMWVQKSRILLGGGRYCSQDCSNKSTSRPGQPLKKKVGYYAVHSWLSTNFGKASKCEKCGSEKNVQWAKLKGKSYLRKRENFWQLCARCHIFYDNTLPDNTGRIMSKETRKRISEGLKIYFTKR